ncbi:unnamed protein product [Lactuca saligna]|uniref:TIR domain-containing protein n=1 Tax=Lactuca saligna TaxID=75948 RepID=A0AA35Y3K1_LACSI|nr:unnamed protein product [Lactuca saligna]
MASSSSSPSAPTFSPQSWKYHVFLSFRGEDTRTSFVDHLYSALEQQAIYTYNNGKTLPRGESIGPSLMKAVEESQIAVIIFSENYADSSWCLDELVHIMECKDKRGQIVMPIFYGIDPSEVRKQKRKYGEALAKHELENKKKAKSWGQAVVEDPWGLLSAPREQIRKYQEAFAKHELENKRKVESWRKALVDASNISGWEPKHVANGLESRVIKEIVDTISQRLQLVPSSANENLIGMAVRLQCLKLELQIGSGGVRMIGIWGVGGGGKTTLASSIYDEIFSKFDGCCFVKNIRGESSKNGLVSLQKKIICGVLKQKKVQGIERVEEGRRMIIDRLCHRKVLIVLDDVDKLDQLQALAGSHDWFGDESRIIMTTRDEHVLNAHKVDVTHTISLLNRDEAIKLFFTVLGSFLCDKDINEWQSALVRLKEIPDTDIVEKLKISFDGLTELEKELFLDIACFFRKKRKELAMEILNACGFHPVIGVKVLIQKALITISEDGKFDMHDLVQEMGHYIVRGEHPNNPEKHSRIWKEEDVLKICAMDATTEIDMVEVIRFEHSSENLIQIPPIVANTKNLRWIEWEGDLATPLLTNFPQRTLCRLVLNNSLQKQLWEGYKLLPNLKTIELWDLDNLIMTPDFDGLPNLETFKLGGCLYLEEIHPSIGLLERLVFLSIGSCWRLKMFPPVTRLKKLETLTFFECPELFKLSATQQNMENLPHVHLDNNSGSEVSSYIETSPKFFVVCWKCGCSNLLGVDCCVEEPCLRDNMNRIGLQFFLKDLRNLNLGLCSLGDEEIGSAVWELPNLQELNLSENKFSRLDFSLLQLPRLKLLNVSWCKNLVELLELPSSIAVVDAKHCISLESFGDISNCKWLWYVLLQMGNNLCVDSLLDSMLQGNASESYFINIILEDQIPNGFVGGLFMGRTFTLHLPDDWYNEFCGFQICVVTRMLSPYIDIVIKQEVDEDSRSELCQEYSDEAVEPEYDEATTCVGYVSFGSLRGTAFSNSSYARTSIFLECMYGNSSHSYVGAKLVPRKSKGGEVKKTKVAIDFSEFWDKQHEDGNTFTIEHDSNSYINILWQSL